MAGDINKVILVGRLTRDPEMRATNSGTMIARFSLASNRIIFRKDTGTSDNEAGFFDCVAFGKTAETIGKYLKKGKRVGIDGSLRWSSWENQEGKKQSRVEIMVESFQFLDGKVENSEGDSNSSFGSESYPSENYGGPSISETFKDDDLPF